MSRQVVYTMSIDIETSPESLADVIAETFQQDDITDLVLRLDDQVCDLDWTKDLRDKLNAIIGTEDE